MRKNIIKVENIIKRFEKRAEPVLHNIALSVEEGTFVSIVGKSGSGKSTLMYILSTMDMDYEGKLYFQDELLTGKSTDALAAFRSEKVGFVFQFHYLLSNFSVLKNVMMPALKLGRLSESEIEHKAIQQLELLGVKDQALKPAHKLSGGQQQRVAIARALINDPLIIFGDEPTGNLDSTNAGNVIELFKMVAKEQNKTIVVVTHDDEFARTTDRIVEMVDGRIAD